MDFKNLGRLLWIGIFILLMITQLGFGQTVTSAEIDSIIARFDRRVSGYIGEGSGPGIAVAMVYDGKIIFQKGYGFRDAKTEALVDTNTVFRLASVSKGFASALTGVLVKEGFLNWDDKVIKYIPDFTLKDTSAVRKLTIRHILSHTTGIVPHAYDTMIEDKVSFDKIVKALTTLDTHCEAGDCYGYQNAMYSLISLIVDAATGRHYGSMLAEKILQPLRLNNASFTQKAMIASENYAKPHRRRGGEWRSGEVEDSYYTVVPAAGINASISDMSNWLKALMGYNPDVLAPEVLTDIYTPVIRTLSERRRFNWHRRLKDAYYAMGWRIFNYNGEKMIYHSGGVNGYLSKMAFLPDKKFGAVILQNSRHNHYMLYELFDMFLDAGKQPVELLPATE